MQIDRERLALIVACAAVGPEAVNPHHSDKLAVDAILADIEAQGFVLVPKEPTLDMCADGMEPWGEAEDAHDAVTAIWSAMIDAAKGEG